MVLSLPLPALVGLLLLLGGPACGALDVSGGTETVSPKALLQRTNGTAQLDLEPGQTLVISSSSVFDKSSAELPGGLVVGTHLNGANVHVPATLDFAPRSAPVFFVSSGL